MNTESLQYFIKVYEKKSISSAAKDLFITPQGLSKTIKQLETDLQVELFCRGTRGMEATEYGELLYARAKHICYLMDDIKKEISIMSREKSTISVVVTYSASTAVPTKLLFGFSKLYPNVQMKLREFPDEYPIYKLFEEEADAGLIMGHEGIENCEYDLVVSGEVVIAVPKNHPLSVKDEISVMDLENVPLVIKSVEEGKEHSFIDKCLEFGFTPHIEQELGNITTLHKLCEADGLAVVSVDFVEEAINNQKLKIIRLKEKIPQNIYLITRKRFIQSKALALFRRYIKENS
ncbi:LysR family transcriptional regulator [Clostridium sp. SYSU_GA19001]|uniref:LysR family transcriptional regulator n=1 Tax=Clostridium caldaquaticum TaxID=2940653 RepID=UPI0020772A8D|nr:LysR family transcriptional regulator [Clostridium caldaquaticum]MCM8710755.1 LysR family transcriptional regulator [Clostridium caldaquaticum]